MNPDDKAFAHQLLAATKDHEAWLGVIRFGLEKLMQSPGFLLFLIAKEASRVTTTGAGEDAVAASIETIMRELCLRLTH